MWRDHSNFIFKNKLILLVEHSTCVSINPCFLEMLPCSATWGVCSYGWNAEEIWASNEMDPMWNHKSRDVLQGSPGRTLMMLSIAAPIHQSSLLCRQHRACVCMRTHALTSIQQHHICKLTVLVLHSSINVKNQQWHFYSNFSLNGPRVLLHKRHVLQPTASYLFSAHSFIFIFSLKAFGQSRQGQGLLFFCSLLVNSPGSSSDNIKQGPVSLALQSIVPDASRQETLRWTLNKERMSVLRVGGIKQV